MSPQEARQILLLYRPGTADANDPQIAEALEMTRNDADLARWFEQHRAFQKAMRSGFRQMEVPAHLKASLLIRGTASPKVIIPQTGWRSPVWLAAAAALLLLLGLAGVWLKPRTPDQFANFQARMVGTALREYRMDIVTNDMGQIRKFMGDRGAPADYQLTTGLEGLQLTGAGLLRWRSHPVTMVCFNRGDNQMLYLFVMNRSALKDPPTSTPQLARVNDLVAASWTRGDKTYVLAGPEEPDFARKYLPPSS